MIAVAAERTHTTAPGMWAVPRGKLEAGETVAQGTVREAAEELDVAIDPADLRHAGCAHMRNTHGTTFSVFFTAQRWRGEPRNAEPRRCLEIAWHHPHEEPPEPMAPYCRAMLRRIVEQAESRAPDTVADAPPLSGWPGVHR